jgi:hypothetical protein
VILIGLRVCRTKQPCPATLRRMLLRFRPLCPRRHLLTRMQGGDGLTWHGGRTRSPSKNGFVACCACASPAVMAGIRTAARAAAPLKAETGTVSWARRPPVIKFLSKSRRETSVCQRNGSGRRPEGRADVSVARRRSVPAIRCALRPRHTAGERVFVSRAVSELPASNSNVHFVS